MKHKSNSLGDTLNIAGILGRKLRGGEIIELVGDLGSGKTAFVRGLAKGIGSKDVVQSPSFTIARQYRGKKGLTIYHFDFYRLDDPGVVAQELEEVLKDSRAVVAVEWSKVVQNVLPADRLQVNMQPGKDENQRQITFKSLGSKHQRLIKELS